MVVFYLEPQPIVSINFGHSNWHLNVLIESGL